MTCLPLQFIQTGGTLITKVSPSSQTLTHTMAVQIDLLVQSVVWFYWLIFNVPVPVLDPRGYPYRAGGVWSCGDQDAAVLSVRRHRQHGLAHGESRTAGTGSHQRHHIQVRRVRSTWPVRWDWIIYFRNDSVIRLDSNIQVTVSWMVACKVRNQPKTAPNKT